tara:strand:- start:1400 stop:2080 length:681 start_codon:yes stop_codon:yes gene_type:complete
VQENIVIVIPAYNEEKNIEETIKKAKKVFQNIIVVDNNSSDKTARLVKKNNKVILIKHKQNLGKSNSLKTGCDLAIKLKFKYIAFMDADGQHDAMDLKKMYDEISKKNKDMIIGFREKLDEMYFYKRFGTICLEKIFHILYKKKIKDIQCGLRIFKSQIIKKILWDSTGAAHYFADAEITSNAVKQSLEITQLPIKTIKSDDKYKGMNIFQGLLLILFLFNWRLNK